MPVCRVISLLTDRFANDRIRDSVQCSKDGNSKLEPYFSHSFYLILVRFFLQGYLMLLSQTNAAKCL
jgi:hypothetical protein